MHFQLTNTKFSYARGRCPSQPHQGVSHTPDTLGTLPDIAANRITRAGDGRWPRYQAKSLACPICVFINLWGQPSEPRQTPRPRAWPARFVCPNENLPGFLVSYYIVHDKVHIFVYIFLMIYFECVLTYFQKFLVQTNRLRQKKN